jgi:hypothetical protein
MLMEAWMSTIHSMPTRSGWPRSRDINCLRDQERRAHADGGEQYPAVVVEQWMVAIEEYFELEKAGKLSKK